MYWVYVNRMEKTYVYLPKMPYWKPFNNRISAMLYAKINGYKLIAKGK